MAFVLVIEISYVRMCTILHTIIITDRTLHITLRFAYLLRMQFECVELDLEPSIVLSWPGMRGIFSHSFKFKQYMETSILMLNVQTFTKVGPSLHFKRRHYQGSDQVRGS